MYSVCPNCKLLILKSHPNVKESCVYCTVLLTKIIF